MCFLLSRLFLVLFVLLTLGCKGRSDHVLRFSAIPDQNSTELKEKFNALAKHLSAKLGVPVEYVAVND